MSILIAHSMYVDTDTKSFLTKSIFCQRKSLKVFLAYYRSVVLIPKPDTPQQGCSHLKRYSIRESGPDTSGPVYCANDETP